MQALSTEPPYLPLPSDSPLHQPEAALLDRHFRLLRENFVGPLRAELAELGITQQVQQQAAWLSPGSRNVFRQVAVLGTCLKPRPCVMVSLELPPGHRARSHASRTKRLEYWKQYGHGTLPLDALVCLVCPSGQGLLFGTVARRDPDELASERPVVGLAFEAGSETEARVLQYIGQGLAGLTLVQVRCQQRSSQAAGWTRAGTAE